MLRGRVTEASRTAVPRGGVSETAGVAASRGGMTEAAGTAVPRAAGTGVPRGSVTEAAAGWAAGCNVSGDRVAGREVEAICSAPLYRARNARKLSGDAA